METDERGADGGTAVEEERVRDRETERRMQARLEQPPRTAGTAYAPDCNRSGALSQWAGCKEIRGAPRSAGGAISKAETGGFLALGGRVRERISSRLCVGFIAPVVLQFWYGGA